MKDEKKTFSRKLFNFFNPDKDGHGVSKKEPPFKPDLKHMPKFIFRNFNKILSLNTLMIALVIPFLVIFYVYINSATTPSQESTIYSSLYGAYIMSPTPTLMSYLGIFGQQLNMHVLKAWQIYTIAGMALLVFLIWGFVNVGAAYCTRGMVRREPVFIYSDFFYAIKRNFKQGFFMGLIDAAIVAILTIDFIFCLSNGGSLGKDFMFFATCALCIIYFFMRFYIYQMLVTFDLGTWKIFKNAFIFSILGIKRNLMSVFGMLCIIALNVLLFIICSMFNIIVPAILPFFYLLPAVTLFSTYGAYPVIEKYMIKTVKDSNDNSDEPEVEYYYEEENE